MGMDYNGADKHKQYLFEYKQDKLVAGQNVTITPNSDGKTATISASGGGGGASALADLTDVDLTNPTDGQVLAYDATNDEWVNVNQSGGVSELANLDDVSITSPTDGQTLRYDAVNQEWVNDNASGGNVDDVVMNGQSIVDVNKVANFNNYVELTQSEYDALPASKLTDGILYCIKDTGIVEGNQFAPVIYSLEEREIGVWTDGKPLYQKTITFQSSNIAYSMSVPHGISNLDRVTNYFGCIKEGNLSRFVPQHYTHANDSDYYIYDISVYNISQNDVRIVYDQWLKANPQTIDLTIQYTKTTDVPGSGTWGTNGVPKYSVDYSTVLLDRSTSSWSASLEYTATKYCVLYLRMKSDGANWLEIYVNGNTAFYQQDNTERQYTLFLKPGDIISKRVITDNRSITVAYKAFEMI